MSVTQSVPAVHSGPFFLGEAAGTPTDLLHGNFMDGFRFVVAWPWLACFWPFKFLPCARFCVQRVLASAASDTHAPHFRLSIVFVRQVVSKGQKLWKILQELTHYNARPSQASASGLVRQVNSF